MKNPFTAHPIEQNMTYWQHLLRAFKFGFRLLFFVFAAFAHGIFPFIFKTTVSNGVCKMACQFESENLNAENSE